MTDSSLARLLQEKNEALMSEVCRLRTELRIIRGLALDEFKNDPRNTTLDCISRTMLALRSQFRDALTETAME